ncbi:MAG: YdcF family protein [Candidatus Uhrbacteria bacterium]|nr:YdcF family protein [Candidatus Uhrbacteria bacterium]
MPVLEDAKILYAYHRLNQPLKKSDLLLVLGSHDLRVAEYAAKLFQDGLAPLVVITGGMAHIGDLLETGWKRTEAEEFADVMRKAGVPDASLILEKHAQNTGDNFKLSKRVLNDNGIEFSSALVITKPYMERRAFVTGKVQWPDKEIILSSPPLTFETYLKGSINQDALINIMVGDLQRIIEYPAKGFQIPQEVPDEVIDAYKRLVEAGYDKHLITH